MTKNKDIQHSLMAVLCLVMILSVGCKPQGDRSNLQDEEVDTFKIKTFNCETSFKETSEVNPPFEGTGESYRAEFSRDGKLTKEVFYTDDYERTVDYVYNYGQLQMTKMSMRPEPYFQDRVFEYDEEGRLVKEYLSKDSNEMFRYLYSKDGKKTVRQRFLTPDGEVAYENRYAYDDKGRVIADSVYSIKNEEESIRETVFAELTEYEYDEEDRVVGKVNYMPSMGDDSYLSTTTIEYLDIDEHDNWTTKIEHRLLIDKTINSEKTTTTKRTIYYYD